MEVGVDLYLEVYIDVIFIINFFMDIILLLMVKKILKYSSSIFRMICGAVIGAGSACILVLVPNLNGLVQFLVSYVAICIAMTGVAYRQTNWKARIKAVIVLYITTFFLGGVMNSLYYYSKFGYYFQELIQGRLFQNRNTT
jgi:stage II sporulation protein GA (sporulation sigma-E factor processing peptidase)